MECNGFELEKKPLELLFAVQLVVGIRNVPILFVRLDVDGSIHTIHPFSNFFFLIYESLIGFLGGRKWGVTWFVCFVIESLTVLCGYPFESAFDQFLQIAQECHSRGSRGGSKPVQKQPLSANAKKGKIGCTYLCGAIPAIFSLIPSASALVFSFFSLRLFNIDGMRSW